MDEKLEFSARLAAAMREAGYEPRASILEPQFNTRYWGKPVTYQAVTRWLKGEAIPSQDKLQVLAEWLKVEPHTLRFGEAVVLSVQERKATWDAAISGPEREVLETYLSLPAAERKTIRDVILAFANQTKAN
ncbi:MAG: hypothetical protein RIR18_563 [Pseudomonadota bacterium]|jgi:transcriptional regulator with XRE-family HTH domain